MTLTEFLLARIAEDARRVDEIPEWFCTDSARGDGWGNRGDQCDLCGQYMFDGTESATKDAWWDHMEAVHRRTRVLAECDAKRRIVEDWGQFETYNGEDLMKVLALPYTNHPDYRDEWRL